MKTDEYDLISSRFPAVSLAGGSMAVIINCGLSNSVLKRPKTVAK